MNLNPSTLTPRCLTPTLKDSTPTPRGFTSLEKGSMLLRIFLANRQRPSRDFSILVINWYKMLKQGFHAAHLEQQFGQFMIDSSCNHKKCICFPFFSTYFPNFSPFLHFLHPPVCCLHQAATRGEGDNDSDPFYANKRSSF